MWLPVTPTNAWAFKASLHEPTSPQRHDERADFGSLLKCLPRDEADRLVGLLFQRSAVLGWEHIVHPLAYPNLTGFGLLKAVYERRNGDALTNLTLEFPVTLRGQRDPNVTMDGGLLVTLNFAPGEQPSVGNISVHT